jgi:hypothetical protein
MGSVNCPCAASWWRRRQGMTWAVHVRTYDDLCFPFPFYPSSVCGCPSSFAAILLCRLVVPWHCVPQMTSLLTKCLQRQENFLSKSLKAFWKLMAIVTAVKVFESTICNRQYVQRKCVSTNRTNIRRHYRDYLAWSYTRGVLETSFKSHFRCFAECLKVCDLNIYPSTSIC